ncbi:MAG: hypothetical protein LAO20_02575 [Acidobacteriia bacterium]|nr:hypothetical protein [Terriglobia bacterium]
METNAMNHNHAIKTQASVRYLLKEMRDEECSAFEEHYIGCRECSDEVKFGFDVAAAIRESAMTAVVPLPRPGLLARIMASFRQPAFASAFALLLLTGSWSSYQRTMITQLKEPKLELRSTLVGSVHGAGDPNLILAPKNSILSLAVRYQPKGEYVSYQARISAVSGKVRYVVPLPASQTGDMVTIAVLAESLGEGRYSMVVTGRTSDGAVKEVGGSDFELRFMN